jgi:hypothetical protein
VSPPTEQRQIEILLKLQRLLSEGAFVASYKYALLLALADLAVERGDDSGAPLPLPLTAIAEQFIRIYWRQAREYVPPRNRLEAAAGPLLAAEAVTPGHAAVPVELEEGEEGPWIARGVESSRCDGVTARLARVMRSKLIFQVALRSFRCEGVRLG